MGVVQQGEQLGDRRKHVRQMLQRVAVLVEVLVCIAGDVPNQIRDPPVAGLPPDVGG